MSRPKGVARQRPAQTKLAASLGGLNPRAWTYEFQGARDLRLDLLRGAMVVAMVVDHVGSGSLFTIVTGKNEFIVSAAEGFIFISGIVLGIVYRGRIARLGLSAALKAVLRRAAFLYAATTALTLSFLGLSLFTDYPLWVGREWGLGVGSPVEAVVGTFTAHYTYQGTDVLAIYIMLVAAAPIALYLLATGRTVPLLAGSYLLWAAYQFYPQMVDMPWSVSNSVFPFATWQALFFTGVVLGFQRHRLGWLGRTLSQPAAMAPLALGVVGIIVLMQWQYVGRLNELGLPINDDNFAWFYDKPSLAAGRVFAFAFYAALGYGLVTRLWRPLNFAFGWLLLPLGQGALLAYGLHLLLLGPSQTWLGDALWGPESTMLSATAAHAAALAPVFLAVKARPVLVALLKPVGNPLSLFGRGRTHNPALPD